MRPCIPAEFVSRWPDSLRPVVFPQPPPELPDDCGQLLTTFGLPYKLTIHCYNDTTLTFTGSATPLADIWERDLKRGYKMGEMPSEWTRFWHLADEDYEQGGGWACVEEITGRFVVIDLDLPDPIYLLNSSVRNLYTTLAYLLAWSEKTDGSWPEMLGLRNALLKQRSIPAEELVPFWLNFIDGTLDSDCERLAFTLGQE
jgi:hypothetical protein